VFDGFNLPAALNPAANTSRDFFDNFELSVLGANTKPFRDRGARSVVEAEDSFPRNLRSGMSDVFNPQELLSKLRAKSSNSTAASVSGSVAPEPQRRSSYHPEAEQKAIGANKVQASSGIRTPISLTLTPSQRQENLNARLELEKEIKRLQDEVASLMNENLQLKRDKADVEQQFIDFKVKSEDTVTKLRGSAIIG
jgi:hypothetical protein